MTTRRALVALLIAASAVACDGPAGDADAGQDAGADAGSRHDAGHEVGPMCAMECTGLETCCADADGTTACRRLDIDPNHCGLCAIDCVATHRGDGCDARHCTCGSSEIGCTGNRQSYCCPPPRPGTDAYCANLDTSPSDCGACGAACSALTADRCDGGHCVCGETRAACEGTPESICCTVGADVSCVDVTSDPLNCGACNHLCTGGLRCEAGNCTTGAACSTPCELAEVCCNGECCASGRCVGGVCTTTPPPDAGAPDASTPDAGAPDASTPDAGAPDASAPDASAAG